MYGKPPEECIKDFFIREVENGRNVEDIMKNLEELAQKYGVEKEVLETLINVLSPQ